MKQGVVANGEKTLRGRFFKLNKDLQNMKKDIDLGNSGQAVIGSFKNS